MNLAWIDPWKSRWNALGARERQALSVLAVFLVPVLLYLLVWSPVRTGLARSQARLATVQVQLATMREQAALVESLRAAPRSEPIADAASAVQDAASRNGLKGQVKRVDADNPNSVRVQVEAAPFPALMSLLVDLQQRGLRAEKAGIERNATKPGTANANLVLQAPGP
jgi:type II secretory pathway component PulM